MSIERAKKVGALVLAMLARPSVLLVTTHEQRGVVADLVAELIELNQRLERIEREISRKEMSDGG